MPSRAQPQRRGLPFFFLISTQRCGDRGRNRFPIEFIVHKHLTIPQIYKSPVLSIEPVKTKSALVGKAYSAAGQATACLHIMCLLQAYQAELLGDHNEGRGCGPNAVCELRRATDLSLRAMAVSGGH